MATIEKILDLISKSGLSDFPLEKQIGLAQGSIKNWRNDRNKPSAEALTKIADYFNVSVDYLLGRTDIPTPVKDLIIPQSMGSLPLAFNGGMEGLTQEDIDSVNDYIEFIKNKKKDKNDK